MATIKGGKWRKPGCAMILAAVLMTGICCAEGESITVEDAIPREYTTAVKNGGTVKRFSYPSKDYSGDQADLTKHGAIYLPPDYSEDQAYDVLILCHGIGGDENEWGFLNASCTGRNLTDHLILEGKIQPLIIVMPNGRSTAKYTDKSMGNAASFYVFGQELRNDLIPYIDVNYATWSSKHPDDPAARDHRAMAGLSMGGMQTINIGLCECLDLISAFGAFSAAPTSYPASQIAEKLKHFPDESIHYFYSICGTEDGIAYGPASKAAKNLPQYTDRLDETNWLWQERAGEHNFAIWNLGLYNFLRIRDRLNAN
ncbi:MAG: hypothetical protein IKQ45_01460 [Clostridia bacterium]|nr:hypothetical protein [Clostridia bacterium]